jgi:hypothetical protein
MDNRVSKPVTAHVLSQLKNNWTVPTSKNQPCALPPLPFIRVKKQTRHFDNIKIIGVLSAEYFQGMNHFCILVARRLFFRALGSTINTQQFSILYRNSCFHARSAVEILGPWPQLKRTTFWYRGQVMNCDSWKSNMSKILLENISLTNKVKHLNMKLWSLF